MDENIQKSEWFDLRRFVHEVSVYENGNAVKTDVIKYDGIVLKQSAIVVLPVVVDKMYKATHIGLLHELIPAWGYGLKPTVVTGGVELCDKTPIDACIRELIEEAGIVVKKEKLFHVGMLNSSKMVRDNNYCYLAIFDEIPELHTPITDGSVAEKYMEFGFFELDGLMPRCVNIDCSLTYSMLHKMNVFLRDMKLKKEKDGI